MSCDQVLSLRVTFSRFNHDVAWLSSSSLSLTSNILLHGYTTICLTIYQLVDTWVVSTLGLLWIMLWAYMFKFLHGRMFSFLSGRYGVVELLRHITTPHCKVILLNILRDCQLPFQGGCPILHSHQQCTRVQISPHLCHHLLLSFFF